MTDAHVGDEDEEESGRYLWIYKWWDLSMIDDRGRLGDDVCDSQTDGRTDGKKEEG